MNRVEREELLRRWFRKSSDSENERMDRAVRMVTQAVESHAAFDDATYRIYPKGSYANETNVRVDSDVDIVVQNQELFYFDYDPDAITPAPDFNHHPYKGQWTPDLWRSEVTAALTAKFGRSGIDTTGSVAIRVKEVTNSRPSTDVVPAFDYKRFVTSDRRRYHEGSRTYSKERKAITNFPEQQLVNGREKHRETGRRYKRYVRALKNAENVLVKDGAIDELPSYFMECLMWNVPNAVINSGDQFEGLELSLFWLFTELRQQNYDPRDWVEPNRLKWLFVDQDKWTPEQARDLALATLAHLGLI